MADGKKMSTAEILAMARKMDGGGGESSAEGEKPAPVEAAEASAAEQQAAEQKEAQAEQPAAKPETKPGERPSVAEMLAMARAEKSPEAKEKQKPAKPSGEPAAKPKPAAKPAAKASPKPEAKAPAGPRDTASVLAAARKPRKPGPVSKSEVAPKPEKPAPKPKPEVPPPPRRPDYLRPQAAPKAEPDQGGPWLRRSFSALISVLIGSFLALGFSSLATTFGLWTLGLARFLFPNVLREPPSQFKVGFPVDFSPGQVATKFKAQFGVWVVNGEYKGQPQLYALKSVCTHLGCTPNWLEAEQKFKCPCHGSGFYKDGINFEGPAPRPLERYAIRIADDGQVEIDKSQTFQEEMGQWDDPASFVVPA